MDAPRPTSDPDDLPEAYPPKRLIGEVPDRAPRPTSEPCPQCGGRGTEDHSWEAPTEACAGCKGTGVVCPTSDPPDGYQWDYLGPDPNDQDGEKWGWINEAGEVWTPPAVVPTSELVADVLRGTIADCQDVLSAPDVDRAVAALATLVTRVTDLEAQAERRQRQLSELVRTARSEQVRANEAEAQVEYTDRALTNMTEWHNEAMARLKAAEAQVAALTQDRDSARMAAANYLESFQAAEAALATIRQALLAFDPFVSWLVDNYPKVLREMPRERYEAIAIARRALAATDTNQTPESGKPVKGKGSSGK